MPYFIHSNLMLNQRDLRECPPRSLLGISSVPHPTVADIEGLFVNFVSAGCFAWIASFHSFNVAVVVAAIVITAALKMLDSVGGVARTFTIRTHHHGSYANSLKKEFLNSCLINGACEKQVYSQTKTKESIASIEAMHCHLRLRHATDHRIPLPIPIPILLLLGGNNLLHYHRCGYVSNLFGCNLDRSVIPPFAIAIEGVSS